MRPKICAIIPARAGSKGVVGKNIRSLLDHPLIAYSIEAAKDSKLIERVIVSTDGSEIAEIAKKYGADVPFLRPAEFAQDGSPDRDYLLHMLTWCRTHEGYEPDLLVLLRPTTPERSGSLIDSAIEALVSSGEATSLRSVHECSESPFKWFKASQSGIAKPIVSDMSLLDTNKPRQLFEPVYIPNGCVDILRVKQITETLDVYGEQIKLFKTDHVIEVDSRHEFDQLRAMAGDPKTLIARLSTQISRKLGKMGRSAGRHVGLVVRDFEKMLDFYTSVFGFKVVSNEIETGDYLDHVLGYENLQIRIAKLVDDRNWMLEIHCFMTHATEVAEISAPNSPGYTHIALTVSDIQETFRNLSELGLGPISPPVSNPAGTASLFFCRDPEGNLLEMVQPESGR